MLYYLSSGRLQDVKKKIKFQAFYLKSGHGRLREEVAYERFQAQGFDFWYFEELVAEERWSPREVPLYSGARFLST